MSLVRSSSSSNSLSLTIQKPATPATTSPVLLPKLNLTPQQTVTPAKTPQASTSTSISSPAPEPAPSTPSGWQHPRMAEVMRRQSATNFDDRNVKALVVSAVLLFTSFWLPRYIPNALTQSMRPYDTYTLLAFRCLLLGNAGVACTPLLRKPDLCEDVPLTPAQRQRLGLPPMSRPATPAEEAQFVTPPRFSRSSTPRGSPGNSTRVEIGGSPASGRGSGTPMSPFGSAGRSASGSGRRSSFQGARRASYNASPLGTSEYVDANGTPTKIGNPRASVALNSKWLYEKGRGSPKEGFTLGGWGTGSVFS